MRTFFVFEVFKSSLSIPLLLGSLSMFTCIKINWFEYESSSLPLYYVVTYFFYNPENFFSDEIVKLFKSEINNQTLLKLKYIAEH